MFKRLFVSLLLLMFVIGCGGGSDSDTTMEQVQEALEEMEEEMEMEDPEEEEEMEDPEEEMEEPEEETTSKTREELLDEGWAIHWMTGQPVDVDDAIEEGFYYYELDGESGRISVILDDDINSPFYRPDVVLSQTWLSDASIFVNFSRNLYTDGTWSQWERR